MDLAVQDLREVVRTGLERGGHLLSAGEVVIAERILALEGAAAALYARLTARVYEAYGADELQGLGIEPLDGAIAELAARELADGLLGWGRRAELSTVAELQQACRTLGLPTGGRHADLVGRLAGRSGWSDRRWVRVRHRGLVERLQRWALLRPWADRSTLVIERLGIVRWPDYATTGGALHADRRSLLAWEGAVARLGEMTPEELLDAAAQPWARAPGPLDLRGRLAERAYEAAALREREGDLAGARALYEGLVRVGAAPLEAVAVRLSRTIERQGEGLAALDVLARARPSASPGDRIAIVRAGKRLARSVGRGWAPDQPLKRAPERTLGLVPGAPAGPRPRWTVGGADRTVESAVSALLSGAGRRAVRGEGPLWTTLYALLFREAYFLPVPGALPSKRLSGPLDVGTPLFAERRREAVGAVLGSVAAGEAPERLRLTWDRFAGEALAGASWSVGDGETLAAVAEAVGPAALAAILGRLLSEGWGAARGLPDLVVLPGEPARLADAWPTRVGPHAFLLEVKGPGDAVRDDQAAWFDVLVRAGVPVEVWHVRPSSGGGGSV